MKHFEFLKNIEKRSIFKVKDKDMINSRWIKWIKYKVKTKKLNTMNKWINTKILWDLMVFKSNNYFLFSIILIIIFIIVFSSHILWFFNLNSIRIILHQLYLSKKKQKKTNFELLHTNNVEIKYFNEFIEKFFIINNF